jgi:PTS system cellobiose-specific IIA component
MNDNNTVIDDEEYLPAFEIISYAGDARGIAMEAIKLAKTGGFEEAEKKIEEAKVQLNKAHDNLFEVVSGEANGNKADVNILMVHAHSHLTLATAACEQAELALDLYQRLSKLEKGGAM